MVKCTNLNQEGAIYPSLEDYTVGIYSLRMNQLSAYAPAATYHGHHIEYTEDKDFWRWLAYQHGSPVLELGCGTGRILIDLAFRSYRTTGVDHDLHMLQYARTRITPDIEPFIHLIRGDMVHLPLQEKYALIIIPCNTYTILRQPDRQSLLKNVSRLLQPGGCLSFSLPDPEMLRELPDEGEPLVESTFTHPISGEPVQASSAWKKSHGQIMLSWIYDHLHADGTVQRVETGVIHDIVSLKQHRKELRQAGLEIQDLYGDFDRTPYDRSESEYLIISARKAADPKS